MHALVTGASGAIGMAVARALAADGYALTLVARRAPIMEAFARDLSVPSRVIAVDLTEPDSVASLVADAAAALGPVDVLVNNAGVQYVEPATAVGPDRIARIVALDLTVPLQLMHSALQSMVQRERGAVVNIASMAGMTPTPGMAHYSGCKAGLAAASEATRVELSGSGVHVLTVYPGPVDSDMERAARASMRPGVGAWIAPTGTPEGLARAVVRALRRREPRVIYPAPYRISRYLRVTSQWLVDRMTPPVHHHQA